MHTTTATHQTATTDFVEAGGISYAYRRFGQPGGAPLVLLQHFRGNLDNWDPALTDALAASREIILVDAPGVGASTGAPRRTVAETAQAIVTFLDALGLREIDLLGFSLGGFVAQDIALMRPWSVRRLILAGTGPKGAPGMHGWRADIEDHARRDEISGDDLLHIFFADTETSRALGMEFIGRFLQRSGDRDQASTLEAREAQYDAVLEWGIPDHGALQRLTAIRSPPWRKRELVQQLLVPHRERGRSLLSLRRCRGRL
jgi:pimeloyl-ACP methyl ester carboxylesterase